jgi:hypothetical protein
MGRDIRVVKGESLAIQLRPFVFIDDIHIPSPELL